jgi:hypothetical protein
LGSLSNAYELVVLDGLLGSGSPATVYVALFTTLPGEDGTGGTEVSGGSYARVAVTNNSTNWPAATTVAGAGTKSNGTAVTFPTATANWGTVVGFGFYTASSSGTLIGYGSLSSSVAVNSGNQASFGVAALVATAD